MNRSLHKNLNREIRRTFTRFMSIFSICMLGVAFFAGIRATSPDMQETGDRYFKRNKLSDVTVMSSAGLSQQNIDDLRAMPFVAGVRPMVHTDALLIAGESEEINVRLLSMPIKEPEKKSATMNLVARLDIDPEPDVEMDILDITAGRLPETDHEIILDELLRTTHSLEVGNMVRLSAMGQSREMQVVGFFDSPQYLSKFERGSSTIGNGSTKGAAYCSANAIGTLTGKLPIFSLMTVRYTRAELLLVGTEKLDQFGDDYTNYVSDCISAIEAYADTQSGTWYVKDRSANPGFTDFRENTFRIAAVGYVFPLIFFVVAALVALTSMTRMVEEQRIEMGTLKALGYGKGVIVMKYLLYALFASLSGSLIGCVIGFKVFPSVIGNAYAIVYRLVDFQTPFRQEIAPAAILAAVACTMVATLGASVAALREVPASLMRPKAPPAGKRVFVEYITFIWKHLGFTSKVTIRNLLRYKKRFFMSVIGIAGSCALLLTGFGLQDAVFGITEQQFGKLWSMDVQAYAYDAMQRDELAEILEKRVSPDIIENVMFCCDKPVEADMNGILTNNVHIMGVESEEALASLIVLRDGDTRPALNDSGAVVSRKLAQIYGLKAGSTLEVSTGGKTYTIPVMGVTDNYVYHYIYVTPGCYEQSFGKAMQYNGFMLSFNKELSDGEQDAIAESILTDGRMYNVSFTGGLYETVLQSLSVINYVVYVLIGASAMLTLVVMLNLTNINITERRRELATLRVLGFYDKEMYEYVFRENIALSIIGSAVGLLLGKVLHQFVVQTCEVDMVMFVRTISPVSYVYSFLLTIVFGLVVNALMRRKVRSVDMVESLKSAE